MICFTIYSENLHKLEKCLQSKENCAIISPNLHQTSSVHSLASTRST